ncbi:MAG: ribonuclease P protein component [Bacteroidota bacterium]
MNWSKEARLRKSSEFAAVFDKGRSVADKALALYWVTGAAGSTRVGFCVGRRLGKAVARNRIKRLLRESWRSLAAEATTPADLVFVARSGGVHFSLGEWAASMRALLCRARIITPGEPPA